MIITLRTTLYRLAPKVFNRSSAAFSSGKINRLAEEIGERIQRQQLIPNQSEEHILKNYMELTEESYLEHFLEEKKNVQQKRGRIDPRLILMILPTLQQPHSIKEHLLLLYPHLNNLEPKQLLLFFEYLLAHKISPLPKLPSPRNINVAESLLVILGQLYPKEQLLSWLGQVPLYNGNNLYLLAMGAFSILAELPENVQAKNEKLIQRCLQRIYELWSGQDSQVRIGVILLALEAKLPIAEQLILQRYALDYSQIDGLKMGLLLVEIDSYIKTNYSQVTAAGPRKDEEDDDLEDVDIDEGVDNSSKKKKNIQRYIYDPSDLPRIKYQLEKYLKGVAKHLRRQDWKGIVKLHQIIRFYQVLKDKKMEGQWQRFAYKLFNFTTMKDQASALINLSTEQVVGILQVVEQLKINKPELIKQLLVVLADRLQTAEAEDLIRLSKCIVTYVRLCEDYLLHFRAIIERRKYIFTPQQIDRLNFNFRRVQVLFPKPLSSQ